MADAGNCRPLALGIGNLASTRSSAWPPNAAPNSQIWSTYLVIVIDQMAARIGGSDHRSREFAELPG